MGMQTFFEFTSCEHPEYAPEGFELLMTLPEGAAFTDEFNGEYWNLLIRNVRQRSDMIDVWYGSPALHLLQDPVSRTVIGVQTERDGEVYNVRARNGVIMTCGGFENDKLKLETYAQKDEMLPVGTLYNTGDGIDMAQEVGAALWHLGAISGPFVGVMPYEGALRLPFETMDQNVTAGTSMINVGPDGKRFTDEGQKTRHGHVLYNGEPFQQIPFGKMYVIFDEPCRLAGPICKVWSSDNSVELEAGLFVKANTIDELAQAIGYDPGILNETIATYNSYAEAGEDPDFGRAPETMTPPF